VIDRLRELLAAVSFHRGLALGALVGSAIAGSTIWARIRDARRPVSSDDEDPAGANAAGNPGPLGGPMEPVDRA
jgi:hypothetical protein